MNLLQMTLAMSFPAHPALIGSTPPSEGFGGFCVIRLVLENKGGSQPLPLFGEGF